jgi:hypothetical protein
MSRRRRITPGVIVLNADDQRESIRGLLAALRRLDRDEYEYRREEYARIPRGPASWESTDRFIARLEECVGAAAAPQFELSYERERATGIAQYVIRFAGHQHLDDTVDVVDAVDLMSSLGELPDPLDPTEELTNSHRGLREPLAQGTTKRRSASRLDQVKRYPGAEPAAIAVSDPGGHVVENGKCRLCGCSEPFIRAFKLRCRSPLAGQREGDNGYVLAEIDQTEALRIGDILVRMAAITRRG